MLHDFSFLSVLRADQPIKDRQVPYATHHPDGIFIATGPGMAKGKALEPLYIADVAPTAIYSLGLDIPSEMEGKLCEATFEDSYLAENTPRYSDTEQGSGSQDGTVLDAEAQAQIKERLKSLGYL